MTKPMAGEDLRSWIEACDLNVDSYLKDIALQSASGNDPARLKSIRQASRWATISLALRARREDERTADLLGGIAVPADIEKMSGVTDVMHGDVMCDHCGRWRREAQNSGSTHCAPPFIVRPHAFTGKHPAHSVSGAHPIPVPEVGIGRWKTRNGWMAEIRKYVLNGKWVGDVRHGDGPGSTLNCVWADNGSYAGSTAGAMPHSYDIVGPWEEGR